MNGPVSCIEFRRLAQADPHHLTPPAREHLENCGACRAFVARQRETDEALSDALNAVPVPDGLAERILLETSQAPRTPWTQWALAASVVMGLALALLLPWLRADTALARAALAHVEEEPQTLSAQQRVAADEIGQALASVGAHLHGDIGQVTYLGSCPLPGGEGKHLVVTSPLGRYSLILMPAPSTRRGRAEDGTHAAVAKPAARGTYAIVAGATPDLSRIEKLLDQQVSWFADQ
jgi:hypothetical protein